MVKYGHEMDNISIFQEIQNLKGHPITGSKFTVIVLIGLILSIGGVASGSVCACSVRSRLVYDRKQQVRTFGLGITVKP